RKEELMKGLPAVLFCIVLAAALVACGQDKGKAPTEKRATARAQSKAPTQAQKKATKAQKKAPTLAQKKQQDRWGECNKQAHRRIDYPIRECPVWRKATGGSGRKQPSALASGELPESWLGTVGTALVVVARHEGAALAHEKVEIRAFVRLQDVIEIKAPVAA